MGSKFCCGPIPEVIVEDREYYCSTMLAFFKPWRTGKDLNQKTKVGMMLYNPHIQYQPFRENEIFQ